MTQLLAARQGVITDQMKAVAQAENMSPEQVRDLVARGLIVIPWNKKRQPSDVRGVGHGLRTKVNANIGTSTDYACVEHEREKLRAALEAKTDAVMDLSTGGDLRAVRKAIAEACPVPLGSVPIYEAAVNAAVSHGNVLRMTERDMIEGVVRHIEDGVDFITIHCGVTRRAVDVAKRAERVCGIVSRGGTFLAEWIRTHGKENPLFSHYDEILAVAKEYDVTLSLGDGMRPGAIVDAFDQAQVEELNEMADLAERAREVGVQVMIEGPGHVPLQQIEAQVRLQKALCKGAPFYVLGPVVTDIAPGYDHISAAIGGAIAAAAGADFLCYVTPTEHLSLPGPEDVREGVIAARIAAHAADIAKGIPGAIEWDIEMAKHRLKRDWQEQLRLAIDPERAAMIRDKGKPQREDVCSMCGEYCVFRIAEEAQAEKLRQGDEVS